MKIGMDGKPPAWVYGRPYMPPLRVQWEFVGVDVLIDPSAQAAIGRRADVGIRPYRCSAPSILGVGVDAHIDPTAQRPKGRRADVGIRPYGCGAPSILGVGVDVLIDPTAKRPSADGRLIAAPTGCGGTITICC